MRIKELIEQTIVPQPPGQGQPTQPTQAPPNPSNTPNTAQATTTATLGQGTVSTPSATNSATAPTGMPQKDFDLLKNQITTLQSMIAKQMQMQQQQSNKPGQS